MTNERKECPTCIGSGWVGGQGGDTCGTCNGTGAVDKPTEIFDLPSVHTSKQMTDVTGAKHDIEILIRDDGKVLWVNVDGVCRLRVCQIDCNIRVVDKRRKK